MPAYTRNRGFTPAPPWKRPDWWKAGRNWRTIPLDRSLARAVAALVAFQGRGQAMAIPPSEPGQGWTVLVDEWRPAGEDTGQLVVLTSLGDAAPYLRGASALGQGRRRPFDDGAMADAWGCLERATRPIGKGRRRK